MVSLAWLLVQVLRQQGRLLLRIEALERPAGALQTSEGDPARGASPLQRPSPPFRLPDLGGKDVGLEDLDTRVLLVHWSPGGGFCRRSRPTSPASRKICSGGKTELVLVSYGSPESNRALLGHGLCPVLLQPNGETIQGFARMGTPAAYLLDDRHRIAKPVAVGAREVPRLAEEAAGRRRLASERPLAESLIEREGLKAGVSAPAFELPDLAGRPVSARR